MLHIIFGGALWEKAEAGSVHSNYDALVKGWAKWEAKHPEGAVPTETDYPHVQAFDGHIHPPALRRLMIGMLNPNPQRRLTIAEVIKNRWLKNIDCCQVDSYEDPSKVIDASKGKNCYAKSNTKVVIHSHLPQKDHKYHLIRLPGSTDM
jgi:protein-serine/threonine kinase